MTGMSVIYAGTPDVIPRDYYDLYHVNIDVRIDVCARGLVNIYGCRREGKPHQTNHDQPFP